MKIAFILRHFPVLSSTFILNQITGLIDRGHFVSIFCMNSGTDTIHHDDVDKYELLNRTIYYGSSHERLLSNKLFRIIKAGSLLAKHLRQKPVPLFRSLNFLKTPGRPVPLCSKRSFVTPPYAETT